MSYRSKISNHLDYKKALEAASRGMIMIHDPETLIKFILRIIIGRVQITHAGMIMHEPERDCYVLNVSKGRVGSKVPAGFTRFDKKSPLIQIFLKKDFVPILKGKKAFLAYDLQSMIFQEGLLNGGVCDPEVSMTLNGVVDEMELYDVAACIPAVYHRELMAVLLLGEKISGEKFDQEELDFFSALSSNMAMAIRNAQLFKSLKEHAEKNHDLFIRMTNTLVAAIEAKDEYTRGHSEGVTKYAIALAHYMSEVMGYELEKNFYEDLYIAGILHDIGKIGVPESILNKPGKLTPQEYALIQRHPADGVAILKDLSELKECIKGIRHHHERVDGNGYPDKLKGDEIPLIALVICVADAFDAMTTTRPYRPPSSIHEAIAELKRCSGTQFHPNIVRAMEELHAKGLL